MAICLYYKSLYVDCLGEMHVLQFAFKFQPSGQNMYMHIYIYTFIDIQYEMYQKVLYMATPK